MNQKTPPTSRRKRALDLNDLERSRHRATCFGVRHGGDFASLRPREKRKLAGCSRSLRNAASQPSGMVRRCPSRRSCACLKPRRHSTSYSVTFALMRLARACAANCFFAFMLFNAAASETRPDNNPNMETKKIGLAIHGGAGTIERSTMTPEKEHEYRAGLERALTAGYEILKRGGSSLDATEAAVRVLEDDPHFNAGRGSVFTSAGTNEMDASIMDGKTLRAGAVGSVQHIKNPINLARLVMEKSPHVMLDCAGAEAFAKANGIELVDQKYFFTQQRWDALQKMKAAEKNRAEWGGEKLSDHRSRSTRHRWCGCAG